SGTTFSQCCSQDCWWHHGHAFLYSHPYFRTVLFDIIRTMTYEGAADHLAQLGQDFHRRGWALGTSGNFSAVIEREPLRLAITASSVDKGKLTPDQIIEVDESGHVLNGSTKKPSAETLLHLVVVNDLRANAVLHTHS